MPKSNRWKDADFYAGVLRDAFASGNGTIAVIGLIAAYIIYKLTNAELVALLKEFIHSTVFAVLGWILLAVSIFVANRLFEWKNKMHQDEMKRIAGAKGEAQQKHFTQPLLSSEFEQNKEKEGK